MARRITIFYALLIVSLLFMSGCQGAEKNKGNFLTSGAVTEIDSSSDIAILNQGEDQNLTSTSLGNQITGT